MYPSTSPGFFRVQVARMKGVEVWSCMYDDNQIRQLPEWMRRYQVRNKKITNTGTTQGFILIPIRDLQAQRGGDLGNIRTGLQEPEVG